MVSLAKILYTDDHTTSFPTMYLAYFLVPPTSSQVIIPIQIIS